jgi:hypothetical protein
MSALQAADKQQNKQLPEKQTATDAGAQDLGGGGPMSAKDAPARPVDAKGKVGPEGAAKFGKEMAEGAQGKDAPPKQAAGDRHPGAKAADKLGKADPKADAKALKEAKKKAKGKPGVSTGTTDGGMDAGNPNGGGDAGGDAGGGGGGGGDGGAAAGGSVKGGGGGGAAGGGGGGGGGAAAARGGGGGGGGAAGGDSKGVASELTKAKPTDFARNLNQTGSKLTASTKKEADAAHDALPELKATMPDDAQAAAAKKAVQPKVTKKLDPGIKGKNSEKPKLKKDEPKKGKKQTLGKGAPKPKKEEPLDVLKKFFGSAVSKMSTKSDVNTSAGPPPKTELSGKSDPARAGAQVADADVKLTGAAEAHAQAIDDGPGPEQVKREQVDESYELPAFDPGAIQELPRDPGMDAFMAKGHDKAVYDQADQMMGGEFAGKLNKAQEKFDAAIDDRDKAKDDAVADAEAKIDKSNQEAQKKQEDTIAEKKKEIGDGQKEAKKKQNTELQKARRKGDKEKRSAERKISAKKKKTDADVKQKFAAGEKEAKSKKREAEQKAAKEKQKAEEKKKNMSWWERAASAVGDFLDSVCSIIGDIFDALSKAVSAVLNAVKDAACSLIDAAISFACQALDALGNILKELVNTLLGSIFPGIAKWINDKIDKAVNAAKAAVKAAGEALKKAVSALVDGLNKAIQAALNLARTAIQTALALAAAVVTGDWEKALKILLEGALKLAGIAPAQFYALVGKGMDTIKAIVDNPGAFVGNLIKAVSKGFGQFKDNFVTHLIAGMISWLTGQLGEAGLTLPKKWDASGIFDLVMQIMGLSKDKILAKIEKKIGKANMARIKYVWGFIEAAISGGLAGLWEHIKDQVGNLWDMALDGIKGWLMTKIVTAAVTKIASMFNPVGAIVQALLTAWNVYNFIKEQAAKIMALVQAIVDSLAAIVAGQISGAANWVEKVLAKGIPIAISLLANLLGLGGIAKKVKEIIGGFQEKVDKALDKLIDKLWDKAKSMAGKDDKPAEEAKKEGEQPAGADKKAEMPPPTTFTDAHGHAHKVWSEKKGEVAQVMVASTPIRVVEQIAAWRPILKGMQPAVKKDAGKAIGKAVAIEREADKEAAAIAKGTGDPAKLAAKQAELGPVLNTIF